MTERAAITAVGGSWSIPVAHLDFMVDRVCSHHSGVALVKERMELEGGCDGEEGAKDAGADGVAEFKLTEAKCLLRVSAIEA